MKALAAIGLALASLVAAGPGFAEARQVSDFEWSGVERVVVLGDLHGDYEQYIDALDAAGLIDRRGRWDGGQTHLVQTGDVPDRGPDTRRILDHLEQLKKQAERDGGRVHTLIGNHEAMNVYGDLRYVHPGEFEAFRNRNSDRYREAQWTHYTGILRERDPAAFAAMDQDALRREWEREHPLGWVEHRLAWAPDGEYGRLVMANPVALKIDDSLFLHGGLSAKFCQASLAELTERVHDGIAHYNYVNPGIVEDELGPLWYRGLAIDDEQTRSAMVDAILERYGVRRIVVGHTPTQGIVWPRFDGRVILNDTGLAAHYGGHDAFLEIRAGQPIARYGKHEIPLPNGGAARVDYLREVIRLDPGNAHLQSRLARMVKAGEALPDVAPAADVAGELPAEPEKDIDEMSEEEVQAAREKAQLEAWLSPDNCR